MFIALFPYCHLKGFNPVHGLPLWLGSSRSHPGMEKHAQAERMSPIQTRLSFCFLFCFVLKAGHATALCHTGMWVSKGFCGGGQGEGFNLTSAGSLTHCNSYQKHSWRQHWANFSLNISNLLYQPSFLTIRQQILSAWQFLGLIKS